MSSNCPGKNSWPELVGTNGNEAAATVQSENRNVEVMVVVVGRDDVTRDFKCDRVWVWVDDSGVVATVPVIG
ncbi:Proteinase inhibitor [Linum grandiflorum]